MYGMGNGFNTVTASKRYVPNETMSNFPVLRRVAKKGVSLLNIKFDGFLMCSAQ